MPKYPPFRTIAHLEGGDWCSEAGAHRLAGKIREEWAKVGHACITEVVRVSHPNHDNRSAIWTVVQRNVINGLPVEGIVV